MPIRAACQCGKAFAAPDNLAGKTVKCPGCGQPLRIPAAAGAAGATTPAPSKAPAKPAAPAFGGIGDLLDEAGFTQHAGPRCPSCDTPVSPQAVVCVQCGFNRQTGAKTASEVRTGPKSIGHGEAASALLERAAKEVAAAPVAIDDNDAGGVASVWTWVFMLFLPILFLSGFAVAILWGGTLSFPALIMYAAVKSDSYWYIIPALVIVGGILLTAFGWLNITTSALERSVLHGVLCMFLVGSYCYYWGMLNWRWSRSAMQTYLSGIWLLQLGLTMFISFMFFEVGLYVAGTALYFYYLGQVAAFIGMTGVTLVAAEEGLGHGLACLLTGIYAPIYGFMRWANCQRDMIIFLIGFGVIVLSSVGIGVGLASGSGAMRERMDKAIKAAREQQPQSRLERPAPSRALVATQVFRVPGIPTPRVPS